MRPPAAVGCPTLAPSTCSGPPRPASTHIVRAGRCTNSALPHSSTWPRPDAANRFFPVALSHGRSPVEVTTDQAAAYPQVLEELLPVAHHVDARRANNRIEPDHSQLKARLRPMRGLKRLRSARTVGSGHAFVRSIRRGHDELGVEVDPRSRVSAAFTGLALAV